MILSNVYIIMQFAVVTFFKYFPNSKKSMTELLNGIDFYASNMNIKLCEFMRLRFISKRFVELLSYIYNVYKIKIGEY
ncbi:hypothetical protein T07_1689 [Trichinella nelsoni]|uniref:Uncharacterized protein n=1 Tax=Trichinella nelsoni TaxID=6336 RepID=A0A0V0SGR8_9BILA|nr:hypothetical protein T07_1689 [Trichinella nelsoni]